LFETAVAVYAFGDGAKQQNTAASLKMSAGCGLIDPTSKQLVQFRPIAIRCYSYPILPLADFKEWVYFLQIRTMQNYFA
jgi:hypothetical protein